MRELVAPEFGDDDGSATPGIDEALAAYADGRAGYPQTLAAILGARVLVPIVAVLGEVEYDEAGLARDKSSDMATPLLTGADGRTALLGFTCLETLAVWDPAARPAPVSLPDAARTAVSDQADALLVDLAGPTTFVIEGDDLRRIAAGWSLVRVGDEIVWAEPRS